MMIVAIMMSILLVAYKMLREQGRAKAAATQCMALRDACRVYKIEYGAWPRPEGEEGTKVYKDDNNRVVDVLKSATPVPVFKPEDFNYNAEGDVISPYGVPYAFTFSADSVDVQ